MKPPEDLAHIPVMLKEALEYLNVEPNNNKTWLDATLGAAGHFSEIVKIAGKNAKTIGLDCDTRALELAKQNLQKQSLLNSNVHLLHANFSNIASVLSDLNIDSISGGILADLGVSTMQLRNADRGFSFNLEGPLDMRMNQSSEKLALGSLGRNKNLTAQELVNESSEKELADIIFQYGEERMSRPIARAIIKARPINTTNELAEVVASVVSRYKGKHKVHPATRTFQAIRIAVNKELETLPEFLDKAIEALSPQGRLVVITFHSLEDRIVKQVFRQKALNCICPPRHPICTCKQRALVKILTPKALIPDTLEVLANPLSRSAKLRAVEKLDI